MLLGFALVLGVLLHATRFGRYLFTIGSNREVARFSGVPVTRVRVTVFVLSGLMAGFAAIVYLGFFGSVQADAASGSELIDVVTAVVLGGVDIFGGAGSMLGVLLALILIAVLRNGMQLANLGGATQDIVIGGLLLGAILAGNAMRAAQGRRLPWTRPDTPEGGDARGDAESSRQPERRKPDKEVEQMSRKRLKLLLAAVAVVALASGTVGRRRQRRADEDEGRLQDLPPPEADRHAGVHQNGRAPRRRQRSSATRSPTTARPRPRLRSRCRSSTAQSVRATTRSSSRRTTRTPSRPRSSARRQRA